MPGRSTTNVPSAPRGGLADRRCRPRPRRSCRPPRRGPAGSPGGRRCGRGSRSCRRRWPRERALGGRRSGRWSAARRAPCAPANSTSAAITSASSAAIRFGLACMGLLSPRLVASTVGSLATWWLRDVRPPGCRAAGILPRRSSPRTQQRARRERLTAMQPAVGDACRCSPRRTASASGDHQRGQQGCDNQCRAAGHPPGAA